MSLRNTRSRSKRATAPADDFLALANQYADAYGWCVLPASGKKPNLRRWQQYQAERPCLKELSDMFAVPGATGLCVIAGAVSGGLVCRDWDQADAYQQWAAFHQDLAVSLPTIQTNRGYHVLFRSPTVTSIAKLGDGELRGRGISLLPTSHHPSGTRYRWLVQPDREIPLIQDPVWAGLARETHTNTGHEYGFVRRSVSAESMPQTVEQAVAQTLPTGPGQRDDRLFDLALALRCILGPDAKPAQLRMIVADWHRQALPVIRTKDFLTTMQGFIRAWTSIRSSPHTMRAVLADADGMATPPEAMHYDAPKRKLVRTCAALQKRWKEEPFFLSARMAAKIMECDVATAWRALQELQFDRLIQCETIGTLRGRKASEWRYLLP